MRKSGLLLALMMLISLSAWASDVKRIGILKDGDYWYNQEIITNMKTELEKLNQGQFELVYPAEAELNGQFNAQRIQQLAQQMVSTMKLDVIFTIGGESAKSFVDMNPLKIPVMSIGVDFPTALGMLEPKTLKSANPKWVTLYDPAIVHSALTFLSKLKPFKKMTYLCPEFFCKNNNGQASAVRQNPQSVESLVREFGKNFGKETDVIVISPENFRVKIQNLSTDLVFVPNLYGFSDDDRQALYLMLTRQKILNVTQESRYGVEQGAVASLNNFNFSHIGRKTALNIYNILNGISPNEIPVADNWKIELVFNQERARQIGFNIPLEFLYDAEIVGPPEEKYPLTLVKAMQMAKEYNYEIAIKMEERAQANHTVEQAEGGYWPQVGSNLKYTQIDSTRAGLQPSPEKQTTVELTVFQNIYDRELSKSIEVATLGQELADQDRELTEQDILFAVSQNYLNYMLAEDVVQVRRDLLRILRKHLDIAQLRYNLETASRSDVLRLEIQYDQGRVQLVDSIKDLNRSQAQLIYLLSLPETTLFEMQDKDSFSEKEFRLQNRMFEKFYTTRKHLNIFRDFFVEQSHTNSLEIQLLQTQLKLANKQKEKVYAKFWPKVTVGASWFQQLTDDHADIEASSSHAELFHQSDAEKIAISQYKDAEVNAREDAYEDANSTGWNLQLKVDFPIYSGGTRYAELHKADAEIREVTTRMQQIKSTLTRQIQEAYYEHYSLRNNALIALKDVELARENLGYVETAYRQGSIATTDLLNSQSSLIEAEIGATRLRYGFLQSVLGLLRLVSKTETFAKEPESEEIQGFVQQLEDYFKVHLPELKEAQSNEATEANMKME